MKAPLFVAVVLLLTGVAYAADPRFPYSVSTLAGTPGEAGLQNGNAATAKFNRPTWLDVVAHAAPYEGVDNGDIYVVDRANHVLRKISHGTVSTYWITDGYSLYIPSGNPFPFDFGGPFGGGVLIEPPGGGCGGNDYGRGMFVASSGGQQIALVSFWGILANRDGHDVLGTVQTAGAQDGTHYQALFNTPTGLARSKTYNWSNLGERKLFVADSGNHTIRRIAADGTVTTIAGVAGVAGSDDGPARTAHLNTPSGIDVDARGAIFVSDTGNNVIRMITTDEQLVTIAGIAGVAAYADGAGPAARFSGPVGIRVLENGAIIVADTSNYVIRLLTPADWRRRAARP